MSSWHVLREQIRRVRHDPSRLRRLHCSTVLATAHLLLEPDDRGVLAQLFDVSPATFARLEDDLVGDASFRDAIAARHEAVRGVPLQVLGASGAEDDNPRWRLLYHAVRLLRPDAVVETGVFDGVSTCFILKALGDNGTGRLYSIDLPPHAPVRASTDTMAFTTLPAGHGPGWLVPDGLRARWTLELGSSRDVLPAVLARLGPIELFFHDSLHTRAHMTWEFETAWSALAPGGLLASDDVFWSTAFWFFCRRARVRGIVARGMGMARKPEGRVGAHGRIAAGTPAARAGTPRRGRPSALRFSVIVPVGARRAAPVFASLRHLEFPRDDYEVLIERGTNPSRNRNRAIARARGRILAFTDDDCLVAPDWLARAALFFDAHPDCDVMGGPQLTPAAAGPLARASGYALASRFGAWRMSRRYRRHALDLRARETDLSSANLFVRREVFDRLGPFDPRLWPNEETELLWRVESAGGRIASVPDVIVYHRRRPSLGAFAVQCFGYGSGRARQTWLTGVRPGAGVLLPLAFLAYLALLPLLAAVHRAMLVPLAAYAALVLGWSLRTTLGTRDPAAGLLLPVCLLALHVTYPAGFVREAVRVWRAGGLGEVGARSLAVPIATAGEGAGR